MGLGLGVLSVVESRSVGDGASRGCMSEGTLGDFLGLF